jgi:hypothetical protein
MAGNSLNLYNTYEHFDLLPHVHGTGAAAVVLKGAFGLPALSAAGLATMIHVALEGQEYYTDILFGTHNVEGVSDVVNDLIVGLIASVLYTVGYTVGARLLLERRRSPT